MRVNGFHNEVRDLIDTQPVARKTNGQQVFSYFNRGRVFTRGVEAELTWQAIDPLQLALSYTYLQAKDRDVLDDLNAGRIYRRTDAGRDVQVTSGAYGGLPGRSRHRATARLNYRYAPLGITVDARARYRGRYGFIDQNGNGIIDIDSEYAPGYAVVDLTLTKTLFDNHALQVGADNLTNHVAPQYVPFLSGRTWFVGLRAQF
jgi:outer membrane receptor for ferrienterochelin and colicins